MPAKNPTVFSTERGRICPNCQRPIVDCICRQKARPPGDGIARIHRQTSGRKGGVVTLIVGLPLDNLQLQALLSELKRRCGSGGTLKDGTLELQGDHRDVVLEELKKRGFPVKKAGG